MLQDPALLQEYLAECEELLQRLDQDLVRLETARGDKETLNRVFRAFHTIKGTSGFMGLTQIVELTHHAEDVLNALRKGERKINRRIMDVLLAVLDQLRRMVADIRNQTRKLYELGSLLGSLRQIHESGVADDRPMLGEIMVAQKVITHAERAAALEEAVLHDRKLGEVLVEEKLVSSSQVRDALRQQAAPAELRAEAARSIRVDVAKLDALVNLVGELVLERNRLQKLSRDFSQQRIAADKLESALGQSAARFSFLTEELQSATLRTRMVPIDITFRRFPRLVRDVAIALGKEVDLVISGEDTELDKTVVEEMSDPLVHLVRNALDHGIEPPDVRQKRGKPRKGTVRLEARQEGDHIIVQVSDDGAGIDPVRIGKKAIERGLLTAERLRAMNPREILDLIFLPGFSTAEQVSDVSGRGVGMDVVRTNLDKLHGVIEVESEVGRGSTVTLRLPLTLAILPTLLVRAQGDTYALPLRSVMEAIRIPAREVHAVNGNEVLRLRERIIPLVRAERLFGRTGALACPAVDRTGKPETDSGTLHAEAVHRGARPAQKQAQTGQAGVPVPAASANDQLCVVVIGVGEKRVGLAVDELLGQEEAVIRPLGSYLRHIPGVAGATIGGDGRVRLILDPGAVAGASEDSAALLERQSA
ncbi:MAG: chemotaxis protein CheA [Candidatus Acidiferrales bacterium]